MARKEPRSSLSFALIASTCDCSVRRTGEATQACASALVWLCSEGGGQKREEWGRREECGRGERDESVEEAAGRGDIDNNRQEWIVTWRGQRKVGFRMED